MRKGIYELYQTAHRESFLGCDDLKTEFLEYVGQYAWDMCRNIDVSKYHKKQRIKHRFETSIKRGLTIFVTLTFTDEIMKTTTKETRRTYARRWAKEYCALFVGNIDYGENTHREHYHFLVKTKGDSYLSADSWKYGFVWFEQVPRSINDVKAVSMYVAKLSNHALKNTCRMPRLIWSRGWKTQELEDSCWNIGQWLKKGILKYEEENHLRQTNI